MSISVIWKPIMQRAGADSSTYLTAHESAENMPAFNYAPYPYDPEGAGTARAWNLLDGTTFKVNRSWLTYDTSEIPQKPTSGRIFMKGADWVETDEHHSNVYLVEGVNNIPYETTDFGDNRPYTTPLTDVLYFGTDPIWDVHPYNKTYVRNLNEAGLDHININGFTKFCVRLSGDINAWEPTGNNRFDWGSGTGLNNDLLEPIHIGQHQATFRCIYNGPQKQQWALELTHDGLPRVYPRFRFILFGFDQDYLPWINNVPLMSEQHQVVTGLDPDTTYYYKHQLEVEDGTVWTTGTWESFKTLSLDDPPYPPVPEPPELAVITQPARDVLRYNATLAGTLESTGNLECTVGFRYGADPDDLEEVMVGAMDEPGEFSFVLSNLIPGTTYYFKAFAQNEEGEDAGELLSFTTSDILDLIPGPSIPGPYPEVPGTLPPFIPGLPERPDRIAIDFTKIGLAIGGLAGLVFILARRRRLEVRTEPARDVLRYNATLVGTLVSTGNLECTVGFRYGMDPSNLREIVVGTRDKTGEFRLTLSNLVQGATYYFKAFGRNKDEEHEGRLRSFTTQVLLAIPGPRTRG